MREILTSRQPLQRKELILWKTNKWLKKKLLTYMSFLGSFLVLISGIIFLTIAINDENLDVEIAFN